MGRQRKKQENSGGEGGAPAWMVTYGDMMGLLLTFFVLLISFSTVSQDEFNAALSSIQMALGAFPSNNSLVQILDYQQMRKSRSREKIARELQERLQILGKEGEVKIEYDAKGGLRINLPSHVLFDTASAALKPEAYPVLKELAEVMGGVPDVFIEVRGHTDSRRLTSRGPYRDNHDLSYGRADAVARYLNSVGRIPLDQLEIIACGPSQPVATNDTDEGRQANRRVELYIRPVQEGNDLSEVSSKIQKLTEAGDTSQD